MSAVLRTVNCEDDRAWAEYLARNPPLAPFGHLRPRGRRSVPFLPESPPENTFKVILTSHPGGRAHDVLRAIVGSLPPPGVVRYDGAALSTRDNLGRHVVCRAAADRAPLKDRPALSYVYTARSPIDDHRRPSDAPDHDDCRLTALDELARLFSRQTVWVFYLEARPEEAFARTALTRPVFDALYAEASRYYAPGRARPFECSRVSYVEGPSATEHLRDAVLNAVLSRRR